MAPRLVAGERLYISCAMAQRYNPSGGFQQVASHTEAEAELIGLGRAWAFATGFIVFASVSGEEPALAIVNGAYNFKVDSVFASMQQTGGCLIRVYTRVTTHNAPVVLTPVYLNGSKPQTNPFVTAFRNDGTNTGGIVGGSLIAQAAIDRRSTVGTGVGVVLAPGEIFVVTAQSLAITGNIGVTAVGHCV